MVSMADEYKYGALMEWCSQGRKGDVFGDCPIDTLPITNPTKTAEESNPDLHSEKSLTASAMAQPHSLAKPLKKQWLLFHCYLIPAFSPNALFHMILRTEAHYCISP